MPREDEEVELGDDEAEEQAAIVDVAPPDVRIKVQQYCEHYQMQDCAEALLSAHPFIALRVMTQLRWEDQWNKETQQYGDYDINARIAILKSQLRYHQHASVDMELHNKITEFIKKHRLPDKVEYAIRGLTKTQALEVMDPQSINKVCSLDGLEPLSCLKVVFTRCKHARAAFPAERKIRDRLCEQWEKEGVCRKGAGCMFAHGEAEMGTMSHPDALPDTQREVNDTTEKRVDPADGCKYTRQEFISCYGGTAQWESASKDPDYKINAQGAKRKRNTGDPLPRGMDVGQHFAVQGLQGQAFLNGLVGVVKKGMAGRVVVELPGHGEKALKPENLLPLDQLYSAVD